MFFSDFISSRIRMTNEPELEEFGSEMPLTVSHTPSCVVFQSIWEQTPTLHCSGFQGSSLGISPRGQQLVTLCAATPHSQLPKDLNPRASSLYTRVTNCPSFPRTGSVFLFVCFFNCLAMPHGMWDLSSPTRDRTHAPCIGSMES